MGLLDLLRAERKASVDTLGEVGPDGPTMCTGWRAEDVAAHLLIQDQAFGLPMLLTAPIGMPLLRLGIRGPSRFAARFEEQHKKVLEQGWSRVLDELAAGPPRIVAVPVLGSVRLHENWIHHEDVRRATDRAPRPTSDDVDDALWTALGLYGPYQRKVLAGVDLLLRRDDGQERRIGDATGQRITASGPAGELALVVAGRCVVSAAELDGPSVALDRLHHPSLTL